MGIAREKCERRARRTEALQEYREELAAYAEARLFEPPIFANWKLRNAQKLMDTYKFTEKELAS